MPNIGWFDKILDERSVSAAQEQSENSAHVASLSLAYFTLPYSMDFSAFWKSYPRKDKKRKAFQAWEKHQPPLEQCLSTLEKHKMDWDDPKYIPLPTTWINENRWEDEGVVTNGSISQAELTSMIRNNECERGDYKQVSKDSEGYRYVHTG